MQPLAQRIAKAPRNPWPDHPIPISLVITDLDVGGAERALAALVTGLDRTRWNPSVICLGPEGALTEPLRAADIATTCLDVRRHRPIQAVQRLARALRPHRPKLVQSFLFHANIATRFAAPYAGCPWVVGGLRVAERRQRWHLVLDRITAFLTTGSVCVSEGVARFTKSVGLWPANRLAVIPNGVDVAAIDRAPPINRRQIGVPTDAHLVLFVGRIEPQKGVSVLLDAAERVASSLDRWHLVIVGDGPDRPALSCRVADSPVLRSRVQWLGFRTDVPALLKASDLVILPSLWEGMPNVVLEAMAARRAVIATQVEGSDELVFPDQTGWLVPPGAPDALAKALLDAAHNPSRLRQFGLNGRLRVETEFTPERVVWRYEALWARILGYPAPDDGPIDDIPLYNNVFI